ncbi:MAG: DUF2207 domain-containing protein [Acidimicrobiales bacterium]|nr:DUF2207 domain-containing protein [Acidimicrobiales bacterium]
MPIKRRRRFTVLNTVLISLGVGIIAAIAAAGGDTERISSYWVSGTLTDDGLIVTEVIDYDFGGVVPKHGIYRDIPDALGQSVSVSSPTAPDEALVTQGYLDISIRIGDPSRTITGRHRYRIDYVLPLTAVVQNGFFAWDAIGTDWTVPMQKVAIALVLPNDLVSPGCATGTAWTQSDCTLVPQAAARSVVLIDSLNPGEGLTISGILGDEAIVDASPVPPSGPADDPGSGILLPALIAALLAFAGSLLAAIAVRRAGRERVWSGGAADAAFGETEDGLSSERIDQSDLAALATIEFEPPRDMSAVEGGLLLEEWVLDQHKSAWLLEAAIRDEIQIEDDDNPILRRGTAPAHPSVRPILDAMFNGRSSISLDSYDSQFRTGWDRLNGELNDWLNGSAHWDDIGRRRRTWVRVFSILGILVGLAVLIIGALMAARSGGPGMLVLIIGSAIIGAATGAFANSFELLIRTEIGSALWLRIESFRRFLAASEAEHVDAAAERGVLRHYSAWAVSLGESKAWFSAVDAAASRNSDMAHMYRSDLAFMAAGYHISSAATAAATAPSSSGSGGGGGFSGSAGGGGGGGGGGSW